MIQAKKHLTSNRKEALFLNGKNFISRIKYSHVAHRNVPTEGEG